ncbi:MAG: hypothetical protein Q4D37_11560 [Oscillospiraceae bacterium]|nr:hypothetical protein [Oscillospiraceae bacterium]
MALVWGKNFTRNDGRTYFDSDYKSFYSLDYGIRTFKLKQQDFEYDEDTNRYYELVDSSSLRPDMDSALVRKRISKKFYMQKFHEILDYFGISQEQIEAE